MPAWLIILLSLVGLGLSIYFIGRKSQQVVSAETIATQKVQTTLAVQVSQATIATAQKVENAASSVPNDRDAALAELQSAVASKPK